MKTLTMTDNELRIIEASLKADGDLRLKNAMVAAARKENETASEFLQEGMVCHTIAEKVKLVREGVL